MYFLKLEDITTSTIIKAVELGAEFLVCGTQTFRNQQNQAPAAMIEQMLDIAAQVLKNWL